LAGLAAACLLLAGPWARAGGADSVQLAVDVIYADSSNQGVDAQLAHLRSQLRTFSYSTYRLLDRHQLNLPVNQPGGRPGHVALPGGRLLVLIPQGFSGESVVMLTSIQQGGQVLLNSQLKLTNRGTILVGGPVHENGVLILAITAIAR
jgi:hypothetical protein